MLGSERCSERKNELFITELEVYSNNVFETTPEMMLVCEKTASKPVHWFKNYDATDKHIQT